MPGMRTGHATISDAAYDSDIFGKGCHFYALLSKKDHNAVSSLRVVILDLWGSRPFNDVANSAFCEGR